MHPVFNRTICSRHWLISICVIFVTAVLFLSHSAPTSLRQSVTGGFYSDGDACSDTLASHVELLQREYSKLLEGVTHVARIGFPDHGNKGDSAIWVAEEVLLESLGIQTVALTVDNGFYDKSEIRKALEAHGGPEKTAIMFVGGGSFGDLYHMIQTNRENIAKDFPDYRIRSFPQSYKFKDEKNLLQAQEAYGQHPDLQLAARDVKSYMKMQTDFGKKHKILLLPDIATMLVARPVPARVPKGDGLNILFLGRVDHEGSQDHYKDKALFEELRQLTDGDGKQVSVDITMMDWLDSEPAGLQDATYEAKARLRLDWTYDFLSSYDLVISDRLHVHILSTVWNIDHITVEEGSYAKLRSYHETWLSGCGNRVSMAQSVREAVDAAKDWYQRGRSFV
ncbi:hypothetical protein PV05_06760 [Exophiala xenobiotica]|uniref:Polysaccharide pyruvyl transferase domain-containing protein n=1 Tax=Exophiala xenobiotica TaxID=348802 RepID=A0A0D2EIF8_9EURO|nr:uncharacterized protein PV05_06760 [Exophiala xenobiotica]KIW54400.1 hypothetical protein PV05_06760 [Exophiala xenobiotica]